MSVKSLRAGGAVVLACVFLLAAAGRSGKAQILVYNNTTNFTGYGYEAAGATLISGDTITKMAANDCILDPDYGSRYMVNSFTFSVANFNTTAVTADPLVRFYNNNGSGGGPGTFLGGFNFVPETYAASSSYLISYTQNNMFAIPTSGTIWAGLTFDNGTGTTGATAAQLNLLGQLIFAPPTLGSSPNLFFQSTSAGSFVQNSPTGGFYYFGGSPVANFAWQFTVSPITPEPTNLAYLAAIGVPAFGFVIRRKRARSAA